MTALALTSFALLLIAAVVSVWNLAAAPRLERVRPGRRSPRVSLLVPARNEAVNLAEMLPSLLRLNYPDLEILVLDDASEDGTAAVVAAHVPASGGRLRLLTGQPLPAGWLGKNWACHQLAGAAKGNVLLFADADVRPAPRAVGRTMAWLERAEVGAVTVLPRQRLDVWGAQAVVPLVTQLPVLALLPLTLVPRLAFPSLSMANGQWLAITREAYRASGGHAAIRDKVVEDVELGRRVKQAGHRLLVVVSTSLLEVRMYRDFSSLREGFRKNLYALAGGRVLPFLVSLIGFVLLAVVPWVLPLLVGKVALGALGLLVLVRACGAALFGHGIRPVLLHPIGSVLLVVLALESFVGARRGTLHWKGRLLASPTESEPTQRVFTRQRDPT